MDAAKWLVPFINDVFYSLLNVGESHTYNLANFIPNTARYQKFLPTILKYVTPALTPITERIIEDKINELLPQFISDSIKALGRRSLQGWKKFRKKLTKLLYRSFRT